ncbi:uroporphyrinogen-III C-methyltransferase [Aneurinibacillus terranovensis]|uniref:uroporphyrinogen-III C-methyltransferase n=1 Tax=Aneurinibacillus terranovensis TaxID=278991 RepID=UPI0003F7E508|nr:uroporphyrinogen-III C-methyltransferase [Aneurinibacillus terranovensis]
MEKGRVYLVGAGPGDPKLITLRGREAIEKADVIVYDRLASPKLLKYAREGAEFIYCGKQSSNHTLRQEEINQLIIGRAREGKKVVRLKGGDPFVFGRGGEEAEECVDAGIPFEVIPGITSGIAAPAYAGIPITHRDFTSSFIVITGHKCRGNEEIDINWANLAKAVDTILLYMGVSNLPDIVRNLIAHGKAGETPVALVRWGTCSEQKTLTGTLDNIVEKVQQARFRSPAIIIVGEVVKLREKLNWHEQKPLFGRKVGILHTTEPSSVFIDKLDELAADTTEFSLVATNTPSNERNLSPVLEAETADHIVFSTLHGVREFFRSLRDLKKDIRSISGSFYARTEEVAERLRECGLQAELFSGKIVHKIQGGQRVLLEHKHGGKEFASGLTAKGAVVNEWAAAREEVSGSAVDDVFEAVKNKTIDMLAFSSAEAVEAFILASGSKEKGVRLASIDILCADGETAATLVNFSIKPDYILQGESVMEYTSQLSITA